MEDDSYSSYFAAQYPQSTIANPSNAAPQYRQQHAMQGLAYNPNFAAQYRQRNISHPGNSAIQYRQQTNAQAHQHRNPAPQDYLPYQMLYPPNLAPQNNQQYNLQEYMPAPQSYQQGVIQGPYPQRNTINPTRVELVTSQYTQHQHQFTEQHMRLTQPSRPDEGRPHDHRFGAFSNHPSPPRLGNAMGAQYPHMPTMQMELPPHQQRVPQDTARPQYVPLLAFSRPGYPPQHYSHPAPVAPTRQNQDQIRPQNVVNASSVRHLRDTQLQQPSVDASNSLVGDFASVFGPTRNSTPPPPYSTHESIKFPSLVATNDVPSERPLETSNTQLQKTVPSVAKSPKRCLDTSDTQPQETVESPPNPAKRQKGRPRKIRDEEPIQAPVPLTEEQQEKRKAAHARLRRWGIGNNNPAWMINPQYRTINGNAVHIEELDREKYAQINGQDLIDQKDMAWQKNYEERQEKINNLRHEMQMRTRDEDITDEMVWDQYYNPPRPTILDPTLETRNAVAPKVKISTPKANPKPNTKAGMKAARKAAAKEAKDAARAAAKEEKAAAMKAVKEETAARKQAEKEEKAAMREAEKEAKKATKATKKTTTKTTTNAATKATRKPNAARKPSSSSNDSETFTASPVSDSTAPTSPEEFNAQDADEDADAPGEDDMFGEVAPAEDGLFGEVDAPAEDDLSGEVDAEYENEEPVHTGHFEEEYSAMVEELDATLAANATEFDEDGYDEDGRDRAGFTADGYDKDGFDADGFNEEGFDKNGFNNGGIDKEGFNQDGFNKDGFDRDGFDKDGYDKQGWNRDDSEEE